MDLKATLMIDKNIVWFKINIQDGIVFYKYWDNNILDRFRLTCQLMLNHETMITW